MTQTLYQKRYAYGPPLIKTPPAADLGLVVVIPCFFEPDLITSLQSLAQCDPPGCQVEVMVVINESSQAHEKISMVNQQTLKDARQWVRSQESVLGFHILYQRFPPRHAGVGLARKVGMDEAVHRFELLGKDGIIAGFDADCVCARNYLQALEAHFEMHSESPGCSIYYEHPLQGPLEDHIYDGIAAYELHLRYYTHCLRLAGLPFAFQTVGSSMAVRCSAYQKQGGMNRRKAGEDFYFLQNIMLLGNFSELRSTKVVPSPRLSNRVPFGTGKAMVEWTEQKCQVLHTYNPKTFKDLKLFISSIESIYKCNDQSIGECWQQLPLSIRGFQPLDLFTKKIKEIRKQSKHLSGFKKRFFQWCNGFFAFKFAHYARDHHYPNVEVSAAASWLLAQAYNKKVGADDTVNLLLEYRAMDGNLGKK